MPIFHSIFETVNPCESQCHACLWIHSTVYVYMCMTPGICMSPYVPLGTLVNAQCLTLMINIVLLHFCRHILYVRAHIWLGIFILCVFRRAICLAIYTPSHFPRKSSQTTFCKSGQMTMIAWSNFLLASTFRYAYAVLKIKTMYHD